MSAVAVTRYDQVVVSLPHVELKKFSRIVNALGFTIVKQSSMDRAMADIREGRVYKASSIDELRQLVG